MKKRADDNGVRNVLIMCDGEGALGDADVARRQTAVENHYKWIEAAKYLGCHSIRVNAQSSGSYDEQRDRAADGLRKLTEFVLVAGYSGYVGIEYEGEKLSEADGVRATQKLLEKYRYA